MKNYSKAIAALVAAALVAFLGAQDGGVTQQEWVQIVLAGLGAGAAVFVAPKNKPQAKDQRGAADIGLGLLVCIFVGVVLLLFRVHFGA